VRVEVLHRTSHRWVKPGVAKRSVATSPLFLGIEARQHTPVDAEQLRLLGGRTPRAIRDLQDHDHEPGNVVEQCLVSDESVIAVLDRLQLGGEAGVLPTSDPLLIQPSPLLLEDAFEYQRGDATGRLASTSSPQTSGP
jgi:hypothetical protein